jgi:uncharacterized membrane protein YphA (DoxX/SURF4 family)
MTRLGIAVYGFAAVALGLTNFVWHDFAAVWQPVPQSVPHRSALAFAVALLFIAAGIGVQTRRFAKPALVILGVIYFIFGLLWLPRVFLLPRVYATYGGVFEELSLVAAALLAYGSLRDVTPVVAARLIRIGRVLFGLCVVSFALNHFFAIPETARMVPKWIPPSQYFWAYTTGIAFLLAAIAILSGIMDVIASRLLTLMILLFGVLIWFPALFAAPHTRVVWFGNAINLTIVGAAWIAADVIASSTRQPSAAGATPQAASATPSHADI